MSGVLIAVVEAGEQKMMLTTGIDKAVAAAPRRLREERG
jgi:hypothetical protein